MAATVQPKIFKKYEIVEGGGHHGGGWKVAYADFMTAMMAFFLLMWILASSDEQKLKGIAEYFTTATMPGGSGVLDGATLGPAGTLSASNGNVVARGEELGKLNETSPAQWEIRDVTPTEDAAEKANQAKETANGSAISGEAGNQTSNGAAISGDAGTQSANAANASTQAAHAIDDKKFKELQQDIMQAMQANPDLDPLKQNVIFEETPDGLHIQIIDQEGKPMFQSGRAEMAGATDKLLTNLGTALAELPNKIVISGHTDSVPFADSANYDNWDLSTDRANTTRRVFETTGVDRSRIIRVSGMADTDPLVPENPTDPSNRRISILVQYQAPSKTARSRPQQEARVQENDQSEGHKEAKAAPVEKSGEASDHGHKVQEVLHAADHTGPQPNPLDDKVFQNLRNALR